MNSAFMTEPIHARKRVIFILCTFGLLYLFFEGLSLAGFSLLSYWKGMSYEPVQAVLSAEQRAFLTDRLETYRKTGVLERHHPILGWTNLRGQTSQDQMYVFNSAGIRSHREFSTAPDDQTLRIAAFGDSFTLGAGVQNQDTWEEQVSRSGKDIEVLNFGVGGYGFDQAYLRYLHEGKAYHADLVILGMMSENVFRHVNVFRPFYNTAYSNNLLTKPRFVLNADDLVLQENPLQTFEDLQRFLDEDEKVLAQFGRYDYHYQKRYRKGPFDFLPSVRLGKILLQSVRDTMGDRVLTADGFYNTQSEAFRVTDKIFDEFYRAALVNHSLPVIVIYPDRRDFRGFARKQTTRYEPLLERFRSKGYRFIDLMLAFIKADPTLNVRTLSVDNWGHYSPSANRIVAESLMKYLHEQGLTSREVIDRAVVTERARLGL